MYTESHRGLNNVGLLSKIFAFNMAVASAVKIEHWSYIFGVKSGEVWDVTAMLTPFSDLDAPE